MKLGYHIPTTSKSFIRDIRKVNNQGWGCTQIMLSNPRRLELPKVKSNNMGHKVSIPTILHGPYVVSLVKNVGYQYDSTMNWLVQSSVLCEDYGIRHIVTHIGGIDESQDLKSGYQTLLKFCKEWLKKTEGLDVILCLENDAGSKTGKKIGSLTLLVKVVKTLNNPRIRICYDTEHGYANGFDMKSEAKVDELLKYVSVIHLNSIPEKVTLGGHLDRHYDCLIKDSSIDPYYLVRIAKKAKALGIPMILERNPVLVDEERKYLEEQIGEI